MGPASFLVGFGSDDHKIIRNDGKLKPLKLAGVVVSSEYSPIAHSDGDVVWHAVANALLLAIGERDIGVHFPDTDPDYEGIEGGRMLAFAVEKVGRAGYRVNNLAVMITAGKPRLSSHIGSMRANTARLLGVDVKNIGIGATTGEGLSEHGRGKGINVMAQVLLRQP